jgi:hypothetical protein
MSSRRRKNNSIDGQFNARTIEMMESPAYRALSLSAHRVLDRICIELAHHGGNDNGKLPVTYDQFVEYGVHRHAIAPAIRELEALGFIKVTQRGRPSAGDHRWPNLFLILWVNCKSTPKAEQTNDWRKIPDTETAELIARAARKPVKRRRNQGSTINGATASANPATLTRDIDSSDGIRTGTVVMDSITGNTPRTVMDSGTGTSDGIRTGKMFLEEPDGGADHG